MYVYSLNPIDFWPAWLTEAEYKEQLPKRYYSDGDVASAWADYEAFRAKAFAVAQSLGWEGDKSEGPYVAGLPGERAEIMIAWKQDNNGTTFIASPKRLSWLEELGHWKKS